jgi:hypothetical protein
VTIRFFPYSGVFVTFKLPMGNIICLFGHLRKAAKNPPAAGTPLRGWASTVLSPLIKKECVEKYISLICNTLDIFLALLLFLPVFGNGTDHPVSVSLYAITGLSTWIKTVFAALISLAALNGICGVIINHFDKPVCAIACSRMIQWIILPLNRHRLMTGMMLSVACAAVFILTRQPYAGIICLAVLVVKGFMVARGKGLL